MVEKVEPSVVSRENVPELIKEKSFF
jgi:hypothetical protein